PGWTSSQEWGKYSEQQSAPVSLTAGQKYYIEALMKEGQGGDNLAVGWQLPDSTLEQPVPGNRLQVYGLGPPLIIQQPADISVVEGNTAVFSVQLAKSFGAAYQWRRSGGNISGATSSTYSLSPVAMTDNNVQFSCFISNPYGNTNSRSATLTVLPDTTPPSLVRAFNVGVTNVWVVFSEPVESVTATNKSYYALNGIMISGAAFGPDTKTIVLTTTPVTYGATYTVTVNNVRDRAAAPNTIAANSQVAFIAAAYAPSDIGGPALTGFITPTTNGFDLTGGGSDIGGTSDQLQFAYQQRTGNFDVKARVQSLDQVNAWTKAGLMARATLNPDSVFASVLTTPSIPGTF